MGIRTSRALSTSIVFVLLFSILPAPLSSQTLNPRWMSEMPPPEKVLREIKGKDEQNAIERQMGAFKRLLQMIDYMAYGLERRNLQFPEKYATPDELRIKEIYGKAYADLWHKAKNRDGWVYYFTDSDLHADVDKLFSKSFHDLYRQAENNTSARMDKHKKEMEGVALTIGPTPTAASSNDFMGLCAAKGLDPITCFVQTGMKKMLNASNSEPVVPGLRMNGNYQNGKFSIGLNPYGDLARVHCGDVVRMMSHYTVERRNNQIVLQIENEKDSFPLTLGRDGTTLIGPVSMPIHGYSPGGGGGTTTDATAAATAAAVPQTVQTTRTRELTPLEARQYPGAVKTGQTYSTTETTTSTEYAPLPVSQPAPWSAKTATCKIGTVPLVVPTAGSAEKSDDFFSKMIPDDGERIPDGLRMLGTYNGQGGARIQFLPEKAIVGCNATLVEKTYTVANKSGMISIGMEGADDPKAFTLGADGMLRGDNASVSMSGKRKTGENRLGDESFVPSTDTCTYGTLAPQGQNSTSTAPGTTSGPERVPVQAAPVPSTNAPAAVTGSLSIVNGFGGETPNRFGNVSLIVAKLSFEDILRNVGFAGSTAGATQRSAIADWGEACKSQSPRCKQGVDAIKDSYVRMIKLGPDGTASFTNIPVQTMWLIAIVPYGNQRFVWNLRVDVRVGTNAINFDKSNFATVY